MKRELSAFTTDRYRQLLSPAESGALEAQGSSKVRWRWWWLFSRSVVSNYLLPMACTMPGSSVLHYLPEFDQINVHWVGDAI